MKPLRSLARDLGGEARRRAAARRHRADQRHGDRAAGIDRIGIGEAFLAVDHDAQLVAGIEMIGRVVAHRFGIGDGRRDDGDRRVSGARSSGKGGAKRADGAAAAGRRRRPEPARKSGHRPSNRDRLRRDRDRPGRAHAARQRERGMIAVIDNRNARATRTGAIPQSETALVLHRLWLTKRFLRRGCRARGERPLACGERCSSDQALTPAPIGHDTPVPPSPQ